MTAYRITTKLGGRSNPKLPVAVNRPTEKSDLKPDSIRTGSSNPPNARIVTPDAPVKVVKNAHRIVAATAVPPGIQPNQA